MIGAWQRAGLVLALAVSGYAGVARAAPGDDSSPGRARTASSEPASASHTSAAVAPAGLDDHASGPEVLARVNGEPVTRAEWERLLASPEDRSRLLQESGVTDPTDEDLGLLALRALLRRRLFLQEAERRGVTATVPELDQTVTALRRRFEDLAGLGAWMSARGLDDRSLHEAIRSDILLAKVRGALVAEVTVTDADVLRHYEAHQDDLRSQEVWLQVIAVEERETAEEIQALLAEGEDFGRLARARSIGRRAARGGDVGWVDAETLWPPMQQAVASLTPGEAIGPLPRGEQFLIVRLHERRPGRTKTLTEARREIEETVLRAKQKDALRAWLAQREADSEIEVLPSSSRATRPSAATVPPAGGEAKESTKEAKTPWPTRAR